MSETEQAIEIMRTFREMANVLEAAGITSAVTAAALLACAGNWYGEKVGGHDQIASWLRREADKAAALMASLAGDRMVQ